MKCRRCEKDFEVKSNVDLMTDYHVLLGFDSDCAKIIANEVFDPINREEATSGRAPFFNKRSVAKEILINALEESNVKLGLRADGDVSSERDVVTKSIAYINAIYNSYLILGNPKIFAFLNEIITEFYPVVIQLFLKRLKINEPTQKRMLDLVSSHAKNVEAEYINTIEAMVKGPHPLANIGGSAAIDLHLPWRKTDKNKNPNSFCFDLLNPETMGAYLFMQAGLNKVEPWEILWANEMQFSIAADLATTDLTLLVDEIRDLHFYGDSGFVPRMRIEGSRTFFYEKGINTPLNLIKNRNHEITIMRSNAERVFESFLAQAVLQVNKSDSVQSVFVEAAPSLHMVNEGDLENFNESYISYINRLRNSVNQTIKKDMAPEYLDHKRAGFRRSPREILPLVKSLADDIKENRTSQWGLHSVGLLALSPVVLESINLKKSHGALLVVENGEIKIQFITDPMFEGLKNGRAACEMVKKYAESKGVMFGTKEFERFAEDRKIFAYVPSSIINEHRKDVGEKDESGVFLYHFAFNEINERQAINREINLESLIKDGNIYRGMTLTRGANFSGNGCLMTVTILPPDEDILTPEQDLIYEYAKERGGGFCWSASMQNYMLNGDLVKFYPAPGLKELASLQEQVAGEATLIQVIGLAISQTNYKFEE